MVDRDTRYGRNAQDGGAHGVGAHAVNTDSQTQPNGGFLTLSVEDFDRIEEEVLDRELKRYFQTLSPKPLRVLMLPPDYTRRVSYTGRLTASIYTILSESCVVDVMPAVGSHEFVSRGECEELFCGAIPYENLIEHNYREDVRKIGEVPAAFVKEATGGLYDEPVPVEVDRRVLNPAYDLVISLGQVVPHEVVGMANHNKNLFVGCGGAGMINATHMIGAMYGMERMMGRADTPVRMIFDYAEQKFLSHVPVLYVLTVVAAADKSADRLTDKADDRPIGGPGGGTGVGDDETALAGVFIGRGKKPFYDAAKLSRRLNVTLFDKPLDKVVAYLDEKEYKSTWVANKAIYRTKLAIADGGELLILAPGVAKFGEDQLNDALIRKYGYVGYDEALLLYRESEEMRDNRAVPAHMIHSATDGRISVTYAVKKLGRDEIEGVGFMYQDYDEAAARYNPKTLDEGFNIMPDGERIYFISKPALGLWALRRYLE